jgi:hypothetical protein
MRYTFGRCVTFGEEEEEEEELARATWTPLLVEFLDSVPMVAVRLGLLTAARGEDKAIARSVLPSGKEFYEDFFFQNHLQVNNELLRTGRRETSSSAYDYISKLS